MTFRFIEAGEFMARRNGSVNPANFPDEEFELHSIPAFDAGQPELLRGSEIGSSKQTVQPDDVMISKIVPHIRRSSVVGPATGRRQIASSEWIVFRTRDLFPPYLRHLLVSDEFNEKFMSTVSGVGGSLLRARPAEVAKIKIPVPPLAEQRRIAAILDKADALRAKRREAIAKLDQLLQSVFLDMFGDPVENPKQWPKESLAGLFYIARGGSPRPIDAYITEATDGVNWIMIGDTVDGSKYIDGTRKKIRKEGVVRSRMVRPGDFLLTNSMSFGRPYILRTSGCIHDGWLVLSPKGSRTSQDYLHSVLSSRSIYAEFARRAPGATVKNLNIDLVSGVEVPVPPIEMQAVFADAVRQIELHGQRLQTQADEIDTFFASLQYHAFAGTL